MILLAAAGATIGAAPARATTLLPGDLVSATYTGPTNGTTVHIVVNGTPENVYADPYNLSIADATQGGAVVTSQGMCFNANAGIVPPNPWNAVVGNASDVAAYYQNVLGKSAATAKADAAMVASLGVVWMNAIAGGTATPLLTEEIGLAMWEITADATASGAVVSGLDPKAGFFKIDPSTSGYGTLVSDTNGLLATATSHAGDSLSSYSELYLLPQYTDPYAAKDIQPFILPVLTLPEPGAIALAIIGIAGVLVPSTVRRRRH